MQEEQLGYYTVRAPFDGVVGDIPVHVGDYVSPLAVAYYSSNDGGPARGSRGVHLHSDRAVEPGAYGARRGTVRHSGKLLEKSKIDFLSPQVDPNLQGILAKAPVHATPEIMRNAQLIKARVIWSTKPMAVVPVLAVTRQGGQTFVYVARKQANGQFIATRRPSPLVIRWATRTPSPRA